MNILSIDQASNCGWAISNEIYGVWDLTTRKDESQGMKLLRFKSKLREVCEREHIELIVYERVAGLHKASIIHAAKLVAIIESYCEEVGIQYRSYSANEIKKFATGKGNCGKPLMISSAKTRLSYDGNNDNEADALWMLNLCKHDLNIF